MSNQTTDEQTAGQHTKPYRQVIAFTLLGVAALSFLWHVLGLLLPEPGAGSFTERAAQLLYGEFIGVVVVGFPVVAVLLATHVAPMLQRAKVITLLALVQYGFVSLVALLSLAMVVMRLLDHLAPKDLLYLLLLVGIRFGMLGLAIFVVLRTYLGQYVEKAPTPVFGGYPQQQYAGQPYPQPPYQPPAPATPAAAAPAAQYGYAQQQSAQQQSGYAQQYGYGQQPAAQQQAAPAGGYYGAQANAPTSAAPASGAPASSPPASSPPATAGTYGQAADPQAQQGQQAVGWPPSPSVSAAQWPPTPTAKPATGQSSGEEVQHTQVIKPEQYRGNAPG